VKPTPTSSHQATSDATSPERPILSVDSLRVAFRSATDHAEEAWIPAVRGVSLSLFERQTLAVVGESGSGKSVTALSMLRLLPRLNARIERGSVRYRGFDRSDKPGSKRTGADREVDVLRANERQIKRLRGRELAMIFQEPMTSLNPVLTIGEQLREAAALHQGLKGAPLRDAITQTLERVGLSAANSRLGAYPHEFSGGMRQRVMIAMALLCRPRVLIADEPTTALDVTVQAQILRLIDRLKHEERLGVILITHDLGLVAEHADTVCVMYAGCVVEYGPTERVLSNPIHPYTRGLLACVPRLRERRDRLTTVQEVVGRARAEEIDDGLIPWWPHDQQAVSSRAMDDPCVLVAHEGRWVGVWANDRGLALSREGGLPETNARRGPRAGSIG
jgi:ABC-type dipeptide/oligopeptide/nickel transport system ATPase component